ncbi:MAG: Hvo_1808 family surface protein [Halobacteriales archaeon]
MQWRAGWLMLVGTLVVFSAFSGSVAAASDPVSVKNPSGAQDRSLKETRDLCDGGPPDPETDVLGWEAGCWANQSIAVNQSDGFNTSELNATVARAMARVEAIRRLEFRRTVPVKLESRDDFRARQANDTTAPALRTFDNAKFEALFLIGEDENSIAVQNQNTGASVLGFYSSSRNAIVLISENRSNLQVDEGTLVHELVHALQDQHFDLSQYDARTRDGANAESGLIEGDASLVEFRYEDRCSEGGLWNGTCLSPPDSGSSGSLANIGTYFVKFQPYSDGPSFITTLYQEGGWAAVNAAYEDPPQSSAQIIHPEKYPEETPRNVTIEDRQTDEWRRVRPPNRPDYGEVGEAALTSMFVFPLYDSEGQARIINPRDWLNRTPDGEISDFDPLNYDNQFAAGWAGDRLHVYVNEANKTAYVWRLAWETPRDAEEFTAGYTRVLEYWGGEETEPGLWVIDDGPFADAVHITVDGDTVTIVNAPTVEQLDEVRDGTLATPTPSPTATSTTPSPNAGTASNPTPTSPSPSPTPSPGQPGFGPLAALAGLGIGALRWRRN